MDIPPGFAPTTRARLVCKLRKTIYGLKQSPREWFGHFSLDMRKHSYKQSNSDHTLFLKHRQREGDDANNLCRRYDNYMR